MLKKGAYPREMQRPDGTSCHDVLNLALPKLLSKEPCTPALGQVLGPIQGQASQEPPRSRESLVWERSVNVNFGSTVAVCVYVCIFISQNTQGKHARIKIRF